MSQSFKLTSRFSLSNITGQAVQENCSAITEAVLHEISSRERDNRQVSFSSTALGRALVLRESEANVGNFSPRRQTNI